MTELPRTITWVDLSVLLVLLYTTYKLWDSRRRSLPPGPPPLPLIGNIHQIPSTDSYLTFTEWGKHYGPIFHLSILGKPLIVLTTPQAALDLLDKRGANYAGRPRLVMAGELVGYENAVTLAPYNSVHRERRRLIYESFCPRKLSRYHEFGERKVRQLMALLLDEPADFQRHVAGYVAATVFNATHGHEVTGHDDPFVSLAEQSGMEFCQMVTPGAFLVDVLPFLRYIPEWFPFAGFKRKAKLFRETADKMRDVPYDFVREQMAKGVAKPSLTTDILEAKPDRNPEEDSAYRWLTATIYVAGADTSTSMLRSFFLAMVVNPEVQRRAQQEIDSVLGTTRLPTFGDREFLPYTKALCIELIRLYYPSPTGLPHLALGEDEYLGYNIPAGATVIANNWGILHDPNNYSEPEKFVPERFMETDREAPGALDPCMFAFGYGRRVCPGRHFAEDTIFIAVATTLSLFDIKPSPGGLPTCEFTSNLVIHPKPFDCSIKPRSSEVERLIKEVQDL